MFQRLCAALASGGLVIIFTGASRADTVAFIPTIETTGAVYSANHNDGYTDFRGVVFGMSADATIDSIGLYQDLTDISVTYRIWETPATIGNVRAGATLLQTGSATFTTIGLSWIDFDITPRTLAAGHNYQIEFGFTGLSNQNFFYLNRGGPFGEGEFQQISGTLGWFTETFTPAVRVHVQDIVPVPLPGAAWGGLTLLSGCGVSMLCRRKRSAQVPSLDQ